jgi:uncharacterized membrane protein
MVTVDIPVEQAFKLVVSAGVLGAGGQGGEPVHLSRRGNWLHIFRPGHARENRANTP